MFLDKSEINDVLPRRSQARLQRGCHIIVSHHFTNCPIRFVIVFALWERLKRRRRLKRPKVQKEDQLR